MHKFVKFNIKKISLFFLSFLVLISSYLTILAPSIHAIDTPEDINSLWSHEWYSEQNPFAWYSKVYDKSLSPSSEIFGERYTAAQVQWVVYSLWAHIWNMIPGNPELTTCLVGGNIDECFTIFSKAMDLINPLGSIDSPNTASGVNAALLAIGQSSISGINYTRNLINKFSPVSEVQAQGYGFTTAGKVSQKLWGISRNISFTFIVLAVIAISFMIMFRVKISPQVVISVQSALPNIIATTILITFSYAIAGFAIDLMYVVIGLIAGILTSNGLSGHTAGELFNAMNLGSKLGAFGLMYGYWISFVWNVLLVTFVNIGSTFIVLGLIYLIIAILAVLAVIWWSIKIIILLLKNFAMIMITIILGPFEILVGAFTGKSTFWGWFRKLISLLAVYPVMGLMFFFASFFLAQGSSNTPLSGEVAKLLYGNPVHDIIGNNEWLPPFSGFTLGDNLVWIVLSFIIFSQITKVAEIIRSALAGKPFEFGLDIGPIAKGYGYHAASQFQSGDNPYGLGWATRYIPGTIKKAVGQGLEGILKGMR